ncbi:hypothetical protein SLEP1_g11346 [Rubroshorea leprosula]|uniref:DUF4378 domain-containing protein n=1 Tax=Rubroshorea leprosula TaxID=152421 RepID=A0AAV5IKF2_9ROSI|nr:hypothetical protein SLEP1_g11346 [Rubroshorea leprosula]
MMAQKHLHELLQEDQEPFVLKNYIADRRGQFKRPLPKTHIQVKKRKPISQTSNFPSNFCKNACFFSFHESPDPRKSPLFEFSSPAKSPCRNSNAIFLNIPARTAALLLEASLRIQKQKPQNKNNGFFGFFLKRLTNRNRNRKMEISGDGVKVSVKDTVDLRKSFQENRKTTPAVKTASPEISAYEMGFSCSCNGSRPSSAVWSESNEEKSLDLDLDTSSSSQSDDFEDNGKFFCESPFHFVLQRSPSSGHQTPVFSSPATSPSRQKRQDCDVERLKKLEVEGGEEEEVKEQCSPVSVLEPPFEDDYDGHLDNGDEDHDRDYDLESSYAIVQRAKQQLLQKLRRFEKLAELDPIELEKRMSEQDEDDSEYDANSACDQKEEDDYFEHGESISSDKETDIDTFVQEVLRSSFLHQRRIPEGMKRLVSDLTAEEETKENCCMDREVVVKRVCNRLESWKEVEANTIDMMVGQDLRREVDGWKRNQEQVSEMALEVEYAILGLLVEEFSQELVSLN